MIDVWRKSSTSRFEKSSLLLDNLKMLEYFPCIINSVNDLVEAVFLFNGDEILALVPYRYVKERAGEGS
jgi:hypothetical protein